MKVFLDTNIFYNNWFLTNANLQYLFHFLNNEGCELLLSKLVIEETENIRNRELSLSLAEIQKNVRKAQKLNLQKLNYDPKELGIDNYDFRSLLKEKVELIQELDYDCLSHSEIVKRALNDKKPFIRGEKGYRDTLIWLSFLDYLVRENISEEVVFITENKSDFFKMRDGIPKFHPDLESDIVQRGVKAKITPFASLFTYVNSTIDKDDHAIDKNSLEECFEDYVLDCGLDFLKGMSNSNLAEYLENSIFETKLNELLDMRIDIFEGIEDPEILHTHTLNSRDVYVSYRYNLRRVFLEIDISKFDYSQNMKELNKIFDYNEISSEIVTLYCVIRPYFDVSFIYNTRDKTLKDYEVAELWLRR